MDQTNFKKNKSKSISVILFFFIYPIILQFIAGLLLPGLFSLLKLKLVDKNILFVVDVLTVSSMTLILYFIYRKELKEEFLIFKQDWKKFVLKNTKYFLLLFLAIEIFNIITSLLIPVKSPENQVLVEQFINSYPIYGLISITIFAPITEEIVFRKAIKGMTKNKYSFIISSGIIFGALHVLPYYKETLDLVQIIPYAALGMFFAYTYYKTNTVHTSMVMHAFNNLLAYVIIMLVSLVQ